MKRLVALLIMFVFVMGCRSFEVVVKDDPFKKTAIVTADMWHDTLDGKISNQQALYTKELKGNVFINPVLKLVFKGYIPGYSGYAGDKLEKKVEISLDDKSFNLNFDDTTFHEFKQAYSSSSNSSDSNLNSSSFSTHSSSHSSSGEWHWADLSGTLKLSPELQKSILKSKTLLIRVYTGKDYTTLSASPAQMNALKNFLSFDVETMKKMKK
jgi:hypothetical protein